MVDLDLVATQAAEHAHGAWQSLLHDEIAVALRAAATPGVGRLEVRRCARQALAAIEDLADEVNDGPTDVMPALRDVAAQGQTVEVDGPDVRVVPASVASAIVGAVAESVRNVARHAPGARAQVQVRCDDEVTTVRVVDDGPGFCRTRRPEGGLRVSVAARMARADGAAQVTSTPGQGTVVTLTWPAVPAPQRRTWPTGTTDGPEAEAWRTVGAAVHTRRRARLDAIVVPFLQRLADADTRVDAEVRAEAELAEQAVRDEMHLPEVLDPTAREALRAARAQGCRVRVQSDATTSVPTVQGDAAAQVSAVVRVALSTQPVPRELTVSVYTLEGRTSRPAGPAEVTTDRATAPLDAGDGPAPATGQVTVAVVALPGSPARRDALHRAFADRTGTLTDDADATWAEIWISG